jgi:DNA-binding transcriptional LysR family regulator
LKQDLTIPHGVLDGIEAFLRVAERRSFSAAAADLGVSPSAISQTIKSLEARVGAPLFMRTTRSVGLTQAGEMFFERAAPAYAGLGDAYEAARNLGNRPAGRLRINLMRGAVQPLFEPIIAGFCETYPEIELEIYAEDALTDLSANGFDAGVRMGESLDADVIPFRRGRRSRLSGQAWPAGDSRRTARPSLRADAPWQRRADALDLRKRKSRVRSRRDRPGDRQRLHRDDGRGPRRRRDGHDR